MKKELEGMIEKNDNEFAKEEGDARMLPSMLFELTARHPDNKEHLSKQELRKRLVGSLARLNT